MVSKTFTTKKYSSLNTLFSFIYFGPLALEIPKTYPYQMGHKNLQKAPPPHVDFMQATGLSIVQ